MLSTLEIDAIGELFNLGLGSGTAALSEMTGRRVSISPPQVSITQFQAGAIPDEISNTIGVLLNVSKGIEGVAVMYLPDESALQLARAVHLVWVDMDDLDNEGPEFVLSIGGEILQLCMTEIADQLECEIKVESPRYLNRAEVMDQATREAKGDSIWMRFSFKVEGYPITGNIAFHMDDGGFIERVRRMLKRLGN